jgi:hypothetical protein
MEYPDSVLSRLFNPYNKAVRAEEWARVVQLLSWRSVSSRHVLDRHGYLFAHIQEPNELFKELVKDEQAYTAACDTLPEAAGRVALANQLDDYLIWAESSLDRPSQLTTFRVT